jgi:hypothetical protein
MINAVLWQHVSFVACVLCAVLCESASLTLHGTQNARHKMTRAATTPH